MHHSPKRDHSPVPGASLSPRQRPGTSDQRIVKTSGMIVSLVCVWQAACDVFRLPVAGVLGRIVFDHGLMRAGHGDLLWLGHSGVLCARSLRRRSGGLIEFELAIQVGRCDGWGSGWQADGVEEGLNGRRLCEGGDDLHMPGAAGADADVVLKNS